MSLFFIFFILAGDYLDFLVKNSTADARGTSLPFTFLCGTPAIITYFGMAGGTYARLCLTAAAAVTTVATKAAEPWSWNGRTNLVKNASNEVWASTDDGLEWVGLYDPAEDTMDEMVDEPTRA